MEGGLAGPLYVLFFANLSHSFLALNSFTLSHIPSCAFNFCSFQILVNSRLSIRLVVYLFTHIVLYFFPTHSYYRINFFFYILQLLRLRTLFRAHTFLGSICKPLPRYFYTKTGFGAKCLFALRTGRIFCACASTRDGSRKHTSTSLRKRENKRREKKAQMSWTASPEVNVEPLYLFIFHHQSILFYLTDIVRRKHEHSNYFED